MVDAPKSSHGLAWWFEPLPIRRARVLLTIAFAGLAFLAVGGALSYASGSPDLHGTSGATAYWSLLFLFHALAFGGAALIGAFPRLARPQIRLFWLLALALVAVLGLAVRSGGGPTMWLQHGISHFRLYLPAVVPLLAGVFWRGAPRM